MLILDLISGKFIAADIDQQNPHSVDCIEPSWAPVQPQLQSVQSTITESWKPSVGVIGAGIESR